VNVSKIPASRSEYSDREHLLFEHWHISFTWFSPPFLAQIVLKEPKPHDKIDSVTVSTTAVTNYYSSDGLNQQRFILSQFWKPEV